VSNEFWEKVWLIVIDKALLAVAGGGIAFLSAVFIERYKRHQAVVLELGKLRAQSFARVVSSVWEFQSLLEVVLIAKRETPEEKAEFAAHLGRFSSALEEMMRSLRKDVALLDDDLSKRFEAYTKLLESETDISRFVERPWTEQEIEAYRQKLRGLRAEIMVHIPPLPKP
jgi:hypothetical protein